MTRIGNPLIDQSITLPFSLDGRIMQAHPGDTLASALLANGVRVMGRSFKYHRPRGLLSDGPEEPNALFEIGKGAGQSPNIRATEQEIYEGLIANSQNRFPSLSFDLLAVNDFLSPFFGAGFYYKSFMWPKRFWERVYEPLIRRAAGLGRLSGEEDRAKYERGFLSCDLLIIGSGLAGLHAALLAGEAGADVILAEGDFELGGRLIRDQGKIDGLDYRAWRDQALAKLEAMENVRIMSRSYVIGAYDGGVYGVHERVSDHLPPHEWMAKGKRPRQIFWRIHAQKALLGAGATERPIAFSGNDRPGIMLAGSIRAFANRFGVKAGKRIAIFTNNDDGWRTAHELSRLGAPPIAMIDPRMKGGQGGDFPIYQASVQSAFGRLGLKQITLDDGTRISCDVLGVSGGWNPNLHLTSHRGEKPVWNEEIAGFIPSPEEGGNLTAIGAARGVFSDEAILSDTAKTTRKLLSALGIKAKSPCRPSPPKSEKQGYHIEPLWQVTGKGGKPGRAFVDLQNDVTSKDIELAHRENFKSAEHMKRYTTLGMATDQGKTANVLALALMAEMSGRSIPEIGTTTFRPPYIPVPIASFGAGGAGKGFAPERFTPSHEFCREQGAPMIEAGLWYRPSYFPMKGDKNWRQSCDREVMMVREAVGVADVSTLGKIDLQGADAARFLDLVYTGKMSTLVEGKARYGLMLREDGMVMDDGTCARLGEQHYLITTTTAAAGEVMLHLEFVHQCLAPEMDVSFISLTDHLAQFAIAGPKSRALLEELVTGDISSKALPFMGTKEIAIGGVAARIYRISFSGELGFEIAVPRRFGDALMRELVRRAEAMGGGVYGMEALNVLRIEKGFITHSEIHGRVSAHDIGLGRMISPSKDCIGKVMAVREGLMRDDREQLVGLRPIGAVQKLLAGSRLVAEGEEPVRVNLEGYVTSVCFSPNLGKMIGLGFLKSGHARKGEKIRAVDLVRDFDSLCEVCDPVFFDPDGERLHG